MNDFESLFLNQFQDDNATLSVRRRNYDLLLKKRDEKKRNSNKKMAGEGTSKGNKGSPDMEELLFEQV